jgi:hypothetical protein
MDSHTDMLWKPTQVKSPKSTSWTSHWQWHISTTKIISPHVCSPSTIRAMWRKAAPHPRSFPIPPMAFHPVDTMSPQHWQTFWKLSIPHSVRNFWWRILHNSLPTRNTLHKRYPSRFDSPLCPICLSEPEDPVHFVTTCPMKSLSWKEASQVYGLASTDPYVI